MTNGFKKTFIMFAIAAVMPFAHAADTSAKQLTVNSTPATSAINVSVKGMVCDFCARGLEKVFKKRKEVKSIDIDLSNKLITLSLKQGMSIDDDVITKLIVDNGISVAQIKRGNATKDVKQKLPASTSSSEHACDDDAKGHDHSHQH